MVAAIHLSMAILRAARPSARIGKRAISVRFSTASLWRRQTWQAMLRAAGPCARAGTRAISAHFFPRTRGTGRAYSADARARVHALERRVQRDEGGRGMGALVLPGQLLEACAALHDPRRVRRVAVLTGFPCVQRPAAGDGEDGGGAPFCPAETDGPPGAVAVAHALLALGKHVVFPIEASMAAAMRRCAEDALDEGHEGRWRVEEFPTGDAWGHARDDDARAAALLEEVDAVVAIERAGPSGDGTCRTMAGRVMGDDLLAPQLNDALVGRPAAGGVRTLGIGDGGNEVGMGRVRARVAEHIPNGARIACTVGTDWLLAASVSNWGGYAVAAALEVLERDRFFEGGGATRSNPHPPSSCVPTVDDVRAALLASNAAGVRDGVSGRADGFVDGMSLDAQLEVHRELLEIAGIS